MKKKNDFKFLLDGKYLKFCRHCGKPFFADHLKRQHCSDSHKTQYYESNKGTPKEPKGDDLKIITLKTTLVLSGKRIERHHEELAAMLYRHLKQKNEPQKAIVVLCKFLISNHGNDFLYNDISRKLSFEERKVVVKPKSQKLTETPSDQLRRPNIIKDAAMYLRSITRRPEPKSESETTEEVQMRENNGVPYIPPPPTPIEMPKEFDH